jgi:hypothetical protein
MKIFRMGLLAGLVFGMTGAAVGQSSMRLLSTVKRGQPIPQDCLAEANALQLHLAQSTQPKGWVNVLACDEVAWEKALETPGHSIAYQGNALLDFTTHTKIFNAAEYPVRRIRVVETRMAIAAPKNSPTLVAGPLPAVPAM